MQNILTEKSYLSEITSVLRVLSVQEIMLTIEKIADMIRKTRETRKRIYAFGNGGSASTASHFAGDLSKGCGYKAFCINDNITALTAFANDIGYYSIFEKYINNVVESGDIVVGISGSGNSVNILNGIISAKKRGAYTIGLTAFDGGKLKDLADAVIVVPTSNMEQAEDIHLMICHMIKIELIRVGK